MLNYSRFDIFKYDRSCALAVIKENGAWSLASSINKVFIDPVNEDWFDQLHVFKDDAESHLTTAVSLFNTQCGSFSFMIGFSLAAEEIHKTSYDKRSFFILAEAKADREAAKIQLVKQGDDNINGVIDIHLLAAECSDGLALRAVMKLYLMRTDKINLQCCAVDLDQSALEKPTSLCFIADSESHMMTVFINQELHGTFTMSPQSAFGLPLNTPFKETDEMHHLEIGDNKKALQLRSAVIYNKVISYITLKNAASSLGLS